jgi:superfamily II DNA or RNA helicase
MNQKDIIQAECLEAIADNKYAGAVLGTGSGKTRLGLKHMLKVYHEFCEFLVVVPKLSIQNEWINQAKEAGWEYLLEHITFVTYLSLYKQKHTYDYVYFDECHNAKLKHGDWIRIYDGPVLGLTGTYPRYATSESGQVASEFFPKVYEYGIAEGIKNGMLNDYRIYVHYLELNTRRTIPTRRGAMSEQDAYNWHCKSVDEAKASQVMMKRIMRMKAIQGFDTKVHYAKLLASKQKVKTLVFTDYTEQADVISKHTYHSKNRNSKENFTKFVAGEIDVLASVQQIAEGANIPNLKVGIVLHAYANEKKLAQKIGRFLRLNPNSTSIIHVLCYKDTIDEHWMKAALKDFDRTKIFKYDTRKTFGTI